MRQANLEKLPGNLFVPALRMFKLRREADSGHSVHDAKRISCFMVCCVTEGNATLTIDGVLHTAEKGSLFLLTPDMVVEARTVGDLPAEAMLAVFTCLQLMRAGSGREIVQPVFPAEGKMALSDTERRKGELQRGLINLFRIKGGLKKRHLFLIWLGELFAARDGSVEEKPEGVNGVIRYIEAHFERDMKVSDLAAMAGLSVNHFIRMFKLRTEMTPTEYIIKLRMSKAKQMLFSTDKIKEVARKTGYQDEHYFSRVFKKTVGVAPTLYMRDGNRRIAAMYYGLDDYLMTLGITPVAALSYEDRVSRFYPVPSLNRKGERWSKLVSSRLDYETLRRTRPDVILTSDRVEKDEAACKLAPNVVLPYASHHESRLLQIGEILGRRREAECWNEKYDERRSFMRDRLRSVWGKPTAYYIRICHSFYRVYGMSNQTGALIYEEMGFALPEEFPANAWALDVQLDDITTFDADMLFLAVDPVPEARMRMKVLLRSEEWASLRAVKQGHVYDASDLLFKALGPSGRLWAMERISGQLTGV